MRLGLPGYLIHGTNRPAGVGMRVTHGCVRMFPEDIEYLFAQIDLNTRVRIINEPVKMGWNGDQLVMEVHPVLEVAVPDVSEATTAEQGADDGAVESVVAADDDLVTAVVVKDPLTYVTERFIGHDRRTCGTTGLASCRANRGSLGRHSRARRPGNKKRRDKRGVSLEVLTSSYLDIDFWNIRSMLSRFASQQA